MIKIDKTYAMSSFLMFRTVADKNVRFRKDIKPKYYKKKEAKYLIRNYTDIDKAILDVFDKKVDSKTGIMLSGGIDSAILSTYMPKGAIAYTLKAIAPNAIDETKRAKKYADKLGLDHRIVEIHWEDYKKYSEDLMKNKNAPLHSIEIQIYKAALQAKKDGLEKLVFGESADSVFGGLDGLLSEERTLEDMLLRYSFVMPNEVLKDFKIIKEPYKKYLEGQFVNVHKFISEFFFAESVASYENACDLAGVEFIAPYTEMKMLEPLDIERIKNGDSKYLIRELFVSKFPNFEVVEKIPMPRPMGEWLKSWEGPKREEFLEIDYSNFKPDQKWLILILEWFLDLYKL